MNNTDSDTILKVASRILITLNNIWNNQTFDFKFAKLQSKGTYVNNVILLAIHATLKCLSLSKSTFVSNSKRQSSINTDKKSNGRLGKQPDIICKPDKDEFDIIGVQMARKKLHLSVLIKNMNKVHCYYNLYKSEIPIQQLAFSVVTNFIKTLLKLQNILIVNMSLLHNVSLPKLDKLIEDSSTIDSNN
ncbi:hypothetical protein Glove_143g33 [Diversispora epigaea]|uniref:Uncharacterized protein n=1 Tax=Diversispora epigaea TaxID=1348612 RepID=A0A397IYX7_9GLOM|nr:hypothetical protein Glove_143g33 [Diversispora epigaea]